jgi:hypothetical protein
MVPWLSGWRQRFPADTPTDPDERDYRIRFLRESIR